MGYTSSNDYSALYTSLSYIESPPVPLQDLRIHSATSLARVVLGQIFCEKEIRWIKWSCIHILQSSPQQELSGFGVNDVTSAAGAPKSQLVTGSRNLDHSWCSWDNKPAANTIRGEKHAREVDHKRYTNSHSTTTYTIITIEVEVGQWALIQSLQSRKTHP